jgi:hypothetical protein
MPLTNTIDAFEVLRAVMALAGLIAAAIGLWTAVGDVRDTGAAAPKRGATAKDRRLHRRYTLTAQLFVGYESTFLIVQAFLLLVAWRSMQLPSNPSSDAGQTLFYNGLYTLISILLTAMSWGARWLRAHINATRRPPVALPPALQGERDA